MYGHYTLAYSLRSYNSFHILIRRVIISSFVFRSLIRAWIATFDWKHMLAAYTFFLSNTQKLNVSNGINELFICVFGPTNAYMYAWVCKIRYTWFLSANVCMCLDWIFKLYWLVCVRQSRCVRYEIFQFNILSKTLDQYQFSVRNKFHSFQTIRLIVKMFN